MHRFGALIAVHVHLSGVVFLAFVATIRSWLPGGGCRTFNPHCRECNVTQTQPIEKADPTEKVQEVHRLAREKFSASPDWVTFFREVLGLHGIVRRMFSTREALSDFEQTAEYTQIQQMLTKLRQPGNAPPDETEEPTRVITVRLPKSLHEALRSEAHEHQTSMNKLCISKLLQFIDNEMVPAER